MKDIVQCDKTWELEDSVVYDTCPELEVFSIHPMPRWKRTMDIIGSCTGLVISAPLLLLIAVGVRLTSRGPIIFRQKRAGLKGKPFICYKFRSMIAGSDSKRKKLQEENGSHFAAFKLKDDPRITKFGWLIRKTSVDELPQLFNVLKGEMSLVGPRPLPIEAVDRLLERHKVRMELTPGITGLWQIYARENKSFDELTRWDLDYALERSILFDLKLILLTIPAVLSFRGAD